MFLRFALFIALSLVSFDQSFAGELRQTDVHKAIADWFGYIKSEDVRKDLIDITCDGQQDYVLSKRIDASHPNGAHILLVFVTGQFNEVQTLPHFIYYEKKSTFSNYVCGVPRDDYVISTRIIEPSKLEKSIASRSYCNVAVEVFSGGCRSKPVRFAFFEGNAFTLIHGD